MKYLVALLYRDPAALDAAKGALVDAWGALDYESGDYLFDTTDYYEAEMGKSLQRRLVVFRRMMFPTELVPVKLGCNRIEGELSVNGKRTVNLDAGYLDHNKVVLASAKEAGQKIYLDRGIYADLVGRYKEGKYRPFEWSFPDFTDGRYDEDLEAIRRIYLRQMKEWRNGDRSAADDAT